MPRPTVFDSNVLAQLNAGFDLAWKKAVQEGRRTINENDVPFERSVFIGILNSWASGGVQAFFELETRKQKDRKRQLAQVAIAANKLADALGVLDKDAAGFLVAKFAETHEVNEFAQKLNPIRSFLLAEELRPEAVKTMADLGLAASQASKALPAGNTKAALQAALGIERQFWELGFEFSVSDTGYAANCLEAVLNASSVKKTSLQYWLKQAKKHPNSMHSFYENLRLRSKPQA